MRKISLDFHNVSRMNNTRTGVLLLLLGMLSAVMIASLQNGTKNEQRAIATELSQQRPASSGSPPARVEEFKQAMLVIERLSFPWNKLFYAIEENTGEDMALLSVQPDLAERTITLDAEAKDWNGMVSYMKRLEDDQFFSEVHLINHRTQQFDPDLPIRFRLSCSWIVPFAPPSSISTPSSSYQK